MEKLATDIYTFGNLRKDGYPYVDKTAMLLPLVDKSIGKQFFVTRLFPETLKKIGAANGLDAATSSKSPYLLTFPNLEVEEI